MALRGGNGGGVSAVASSVAVDYSTITGVSAGDTAIIAVGWNFNATTVITPTGWTPLDVPVGSSGNQLAVFFKTLTAAEVTAGSVTVSFSATSRVAWAVAV